MRTEKKAGSLRNTPKKSNLSNLKGGIIIIDKPRGLTSHDVVNRLRRIFGIRKVGHAGTLDPAATGVLVILIGRATGLSSRFTGQEKEYLIGVEFGRKTDTGDVEGQTLSELPPSNRRLLLLTQTRIEDALVSLRGKVKQRVPAFSAVKVRGRKLYELARRGRKAKRPIREVEVKELNLEEFERGGEGKYPRARLRAVVSAGTYTRALVEDLGKVLNVPAYQVALRRVRSGQFSIHEAVTLEALEKEKNPEKLLGN